MEDPVAYLGEFEVLCLRLPRRKGMRGRSFNAYFDKAVGAHSSRIKYL